MIQYFLLKERNYAKIDGSFRGQDRSLIPGNYNNYDDAFNEAQKLPQEKDDIVYVVEVTTKIYGDMKIKENYNGTP